MNDVWDRPYSALRYAAENDHERVARLLIEHGASVHYSDDKGDYVRDRNYIYQEFIQGLFLLLVKIGVMVIVEIGMMVVVEIGLE